jgi:hypothetical protein
MGGKPTGQAKPMKHVHSARQSERLGRAGRGEQPDGHYSMSGVQSKVVTVQK